MCYNATASIGSFVVSLLGSSFLFMRNNRDDRVFSCILFGVSIMQLGEYLIHHDLDCKHPKQLNKLGSTLGFYSHLFIQPLFALLGTIFFGTIGINGVSDSNSNGVYVYPLLALWFSLWFVYVKYAYDNYPSKKDWCSYQYPCDKTSEKIGCQLYWPWFTSIHEPLYMILVFLLPILFSKVITHKIFWIIYVLLGPVLLLQVYPKTAGSLWCFLGPGLTIFTKMLL